MDGVLTAVRGNIANIAGIMEGIQNANARVDRVKERVTDRYRGQSESAPPIVEGSAAISGSGQNDAGCRRSRRGGRSSSGGIIDHKRRRRR
mmetsp:Transcript_44373/g.49760  ORF Transcript_44373/g.49760 Transcript_44373/m.49760 type:complete len:91 (-) Transcript_44373:760-1032(-)